MADFIRSRQIHGKTKKDLSIILGFGQVAWNFILSIYKAEWNILKTDQNNRLF